MKTKVIAFRVTQDEYDALSYIAKMYGVKISEHVANCLEGDIMQGVNAMLKEQKRLEAKAKREAKKAAANGAQ